MMPFRCIFLFLFQSLAISIYGQNHLNIDPAKVSDNFLKIDYFNSIWLKSADINKDDAAGFTRRASEKIEKGFYEEAYSDISSAIKLRPDYGLPFLLKGIYFLHRNMVDSAEVSLKQSLAIDSLDVRTMFYLGLTRLYSKDYEGAKSFFRKINKVDDNDCRGYYGLATVELEKGNYNAGRNLMKKAVNIDSKFVQAVFSLGIMDLMENNIKSAEDNMDQIVSADPGFAPAWFIKGLIKSMDVSKIKASFNCFNKAIELEPTNISYLSARISAYRKLVMLD